MIPSGNFTTVVSPNPEEPAALEMAMDLARITNGDIVLGTDPDGDRLGIAVRNLEGEMPVEKSWKNYWKRIHRFYDCDL